MNTQKEVFWRDSLRKSQTATNSISLNICPKFKRNSFRASILNEIDSKRLKGIYAPAKPFSASESITNNKLFYNSNLSKLTESLQGVASVFQEIIHKQTEELAIISSENQLLSKKIVLLNNSEENFQVRNEELTSKPDSEEKILEYYKNSIKKAEEMLNKQKSEFESTLQRLASEKHELEQEILSKYS